MQDLLNPGLVFLLTFALAAVHFVAEELEESLEGYHESIFSFATGVSVTYIFVRLIPEFHRIAIDSTETIFVAPLIGFSSIHLAEKYIAKTEQSRQKMVREYGEIHSAFLFMYHGAIGFLIASLVSQNTVSGLLFFVPVMLHIGLSSFSLSELDEEIASMLSVKILVSSAPLLGALTYAAGIVSEQFFNPVFGVVIGMFMYVVIRDSIPGGDEGRPGEYILGMLLYLGVILITNFL